MTKAIVGEKIRQVDNGVDEFRNYLDQKGENARSAASSTQGQETRIQVEQVLDDGRRINQAIARGNYGSQAARLRAALRNSINDLARAYGLTPLGV